MAHARRAHTPLVFIFLWPAWNICNQLCIGSVKMSSGTKKFKKIVCITKEMNKGTRRCYKVCVFRALQMTKSIFTSDWFVWTGEIATNWNLVRNNWTETIFPNVILFTVVQSKSKKKTTMLCDSRCVILAWVESTGRAAWSAVSHEGPDEASRMKDYIKKAALLNNFVYKTSVGIWFISLYLSFGLG